MANVKINVRVKPYYWGKKSLDGNPYRFDFRWNTNQEKWYMDIKGLANDVDKKGIALLGGKDLFAPFGFVELGELWMIDNSGADGDPDYSGMGSQYTLEYVPLADL